MQSKMLYGRPIPVGRAVQGIADRKSEHTPRSASLIKTDDVDQVRKTTHSSMDVDHMGLGSWLLVEM
jgi:hypothetical protein